MSDKKYPEVNGYCPAGCARPVVSKQEFDDKNIVVVNKEGKQLKMIIEIDEQTGDINFKTELLDTSAE